MITVWTSLAHSNPRSRWFAISCPHNHWRFPRDPSFQFHLQVLGTPVVSFWGTFQMCLMLGSPTPDQTDSMNKSTSWQIEPGQKSNVLTTQPRAHSLLTEYPIDKYIALLACHDIWLWRAMSCYNLGTLFSHNYSLRQQQNGILSTLLPSPSLNILEKIRILF